MDSCIDPMLASALGRDYQIIVRPHPEYIKRYRARWDAFKTRYADVPREELVFEGDFSGFDFIPQADLIVTNWSSIFCEFCFTTFKPAIFMDTPPKVRNPTTSGFGIDSTDVAYATVWESPYPLKTQAPSETWSPSFCALARCGKNAFVMYATASCSTWGTAARRRGAICSVPC